MKKTKKKFFLHLINIITVALTVECFLCSILAVRVNARENCYTRIREITEEMASDIKHEIDGNYAELDHFAELLAANLLAPSVVKSYSDAFCETQGFADVEVYAADGTLIYRAKEISEKVSPDTDKALPYVSRAFFVSDEGYFYQAVPIKSGETMIGAVRGYLSLSRLESCGDSKAYEGKCRFSVIDRESGKLLTNAISADVTSLNDAVEKHETKLEYTASQMKESVLRGEEGYYIYKTEGESEWYYSYYMPLDRSINRWSIHMSVNERTAFASFRDVESIVLMLAICVIVLMFTHVFVLMIQSSHTNKNDKQRLKKTKYINDIQRCLLNAHNNSNFIEQALKIVAEKMRAETVMLLSVNDKTVRNAYYWPSKDKVTVMNLVGRNIRDDFPVIFDKLFENSNFVFYPEDEFEEISDNAKLVFEQLEVSNIMIVPILDNSGTLKGALCAANMAEKTYNCEPLECVTYDFFMAITNVENIEIIRNMGMMDYLTGVKNRNSYEAELSSYATLNASSLACVFIDVNGLHETNNTEGHKAGDNLLCAVADAVKRCFSKNMTYRLGGDEFVAFVPDVTEEILLRKTAKMEHDLAARQYYISVGFDIILKNEYGIFDIDMLVVESERKMYREKREFYKDKARPSARASLFEDDDDIK